MTVPVVSKTPKSFVARAMIGLGLLATWLGRRALLAYYQRAIQEATEPYIRYAGGAILWIAGSLIVWFGLLMTGSHGLLTGFALVYVVGALYIAFLPIFSITFSSLSAGIDASTPGDQPNLQLFAEGFAVYRRKVMTAMLWVAVFFFVTIIVPYKSSPATFCLSILALLIILLGIWSEKFNVSEKPYKIVEWCAIAFVLFGMVFAAVNAVPPEIYARFDIEVEDSGVRPSETKRLESKRASKELADKRLEKAEASILALQECRVSETSQKTFTEKMQSYYDAHCGKGVDPKGMTRDEVRAQWSYLFLADQNKSGAGGGTAEVPKGSEGASFSLMNPATWVLWAKEHPTKAIIILLLHAPLIWLIKRAWGSKRGSPETSSTVTQAKEQKSGPDLAIPVLEGLLWRGIPLLALAVVPAIGFGIVSDLGILWAPIATLALWLSLGKASQLSFNRSPKGVPRHKGLERTKSMTGALTLIAFIGVFGYYSANPDAWSVLARGVTEASDGARGLRGLGPDLSRITKLPKKEAGISLGSASLYEAQYTMRSYQPPHYGEDAVIDSHKKVSPWLRLTPDSFIVGEKMSIGFDFGGGLGIRLSGSCTPAESWGRKMCVGYWRNAAGTVNNAFRLTYERDDETFRVDLFPDTTLPDTNKGGVRNIYVRRKVQ